MNRPAVLKFGGSSFPDTGSYGTLAGTLADRILRDGPLAVVVSAMPGETEKLRVLLREVDKHPADSSVAGLLTLADTVSAHLLAAALHDLGCSATVLAGHQLGITTSSQGESSAMWSRVARIAPEPLTRALATHDAVIIPGGQAVDDEGRPTWLGKNSSDLSAVAAAVAIGADQCEIYSDVDGIYSSDPNLVPGSRLMRSLSYESATVMAQYGAKVLHRRAVALARHHGIPIVCRSNRAPFHVGTTIGATGDVLAAVVVNQKSRVYEYADDAKADMAHNTLRLHGIDTVRLVDGPLLAVIGGYVDLETIQQSRDMPAGRPVGIPVAEVAGAKITVHIAADEAAAARLARGLHPTLPEIRPTEAALANGYPLS